MIIYASLELHGNISTVNHLWQVGPMSENTPMMHSVAPSSPNVKSMGSLDFLSGWIKATRSPSTTLKNVHGILNTVGWGILMPVGAVIARYLKKFESADPLWFYLHVSCQLLAYILGGLSGFGTGIFLGIRSHGIEHSCHKIIGIVLFCLATAQVFGGLVRPDKDSKCNSVKRAWDAHFGRLSKTGPRGAGSHANSGRNRQRRFMRLKVRQRKIGSADC
jgi:hypothetical protein